MKLKHLAMIAALAFLAPGCAALSAVTGAIPPVAGQAGGGVASGTLLDEKALYAAETAYNVPATAYKTIDQAQKPPMAAAQWAAIKPTAKALLVDAKKYLDGARAAYALGDAATFGAQLDAAKALLATVKTLMPAPAGK